MLSVGDGRARRWGALLPLCVAILSAMHAGRATAEDPGAVPTDPPALSLPDAARQDFAGRFQGEPAGALRFLRPEAAALPLPPQAEAPPPPESLLDPGLLGPVRASTFAPADPTRTGGVSAGSRNDTCPDPAVADGGPQPGPLLEEGEAVWYQLPGNTANGEVFDPDGFTAGHRTLPFGTWIRVVNQENGRSVVVRINDRGPVQRKFVIDLSRGSARALGIEGKARVSLHAAEPPDKAGTPVAQTLDPPR